MDAAGHGVPDTGARHRQSPQRMLVLQDVTELSGWSGPGATSYHIGTSAYPASSIKLLVETITQSERDDPAHQDF